MLFDTTKVAGLVGLMAGAAQAQYALDSFFDVNNFMSEFTFFTDPDPTHGFVQYVDQQTALNTNLASTADGVVRLGADATESNPANGRKSTRVTSNKSWTHALVLGDFAHMPDSVCGVWPAFWLTGPDWPNSGEIDVIEGVNTQSATSVTLHSAQGCTITNDGTDPTTILNGGDCAKDNSNGGCGQSTAGTTNYGTGFNGVNGGVYAMEWTSDAISIWFWQRDAIPQDIANQQPDPSTWGLPIAKFNGGQGCNLDDFFKEQQIVINTTFCGDWAGAADVWGNNPECSAKAASCQDFVANNPQEYENANWVINSVSVYTQGGATKKVDNHSSNHTMASRSFRS